MFVMKHGAPGDVVQNYDEFVLRISVHRDSRAWSGWSQYILVTVPARGVTFLHWASIPPSQEQLDRWVKTGGHR